MEFEDLKRKSSLPSKWDKKHSNHQPKNEFLFKVLVIGELGTGKTSFIRRYVHTYFSENYRATIGVDFSLKVINWNENDEDGETVIRLQMWDIAGQERFGNMTRVYYRVSTEVNIVLFLNVRYIDIC